MERIGFIWIYVNLPRCSYLPGTSPCRKADPVNSACPVSTEALSVIKKIMNFTGSFTPEAAGGSSSELAGMTMEIDKEDEQVVLSERSSTFT